MNIESVKAIILSVYPGWEKKLKKMTDKQIEAIYLSLRKRGLVP